MPDSPGSDTMLYRSESNGTIGAFAGELSTFRDDGVSRKLFFDTDGMAADRDLSATDDGAPALAGRLAVVLPSFVTLVSNGDTLSPVVGPAINFSLDRPSVAAAWSLPLFTRVLDAHGDAVFAFPNFATSLGQPIHWTVAIARPLDGLNCSDPVVTNP
ncbi:MAG: hypothetical protein IPM29_30495 [Planctomycetes bacterium]|nr:hypothetical protein [Planctomycetota bacterium]